MKHVDFRRNNTTIWKKLSYQINHPSLIKIPCVLFINKHIHSTVVLSLTLSRLPREFDENRASTALQIKTSTRHTLLFYLVSSNIFTSGYAHASIFSRAMQNAVAATAASAVPDYAGISDCAQAIDRHVFSRECGNTYACVHVCMCVCVCVCTGGRFSHRRQS